MNNHLLDYQTRVEKLNERSIDIYPIYLRRDLQDYGVKARCLVDYQNKEVSFDIVSVVVHVYPLTFLLGIAFLIKQYRYLYAQLSSSFCVVFFVCVCVFLCPQRQSSWGGVLLLGLSSIYSSAGSSVSSSIH